MKATPPERRWRCCRSSGTGQTHLQGDYTDTVARGPALARGSRGLRRRSARPRQRADVRPRAGRDRALRGLRADARRAAWPIRPNVPWTTSCGPSTAGGGWRYEPGQAGDTSVVGWQLMALRQREIGLSQGAHRFVHRGGQVSRQRADAAQHWPLRLHAAAAAPRPP